MLQNQERVTANAFPARGVKSYGTSSPPCPGHNGEPVPREERFAALLSKRPASDRNPSLLWRALAGTGVLALFVVGVSLASSQRSSTVRWELNGERGGPATGSTMLGVRVACALVFFWHALALNWATSGHCAPLLCTGKRTDLLLYNSSSSSMCIY